MTAYETVFVLQFLIYITIFLVKIYNIMTLPSANRLKRQMTEQQILENKTRLFPYDLKISFILFIITLFSYGLGLVIFLQNPESNNLLFSSLIQLQSWLLLINLFILLFELLFDWGISLSDKAIKAKMNLIPTSRNR